MSSTYYIILPIISYHPIKYLVIFDNKKRAKNVFLSLNTSRKIISKCLSGNNLFTRIYHLRGFLYIFSPTILNTSMKIVKQVTFLSSYCNFHLQLDEVTCCNCQGVCWKWSRLCIPSSVTTLP